MDRCTTLNSSSHLSGDDAGDQQQGDSDPMSNTATVFEQQPQYVERFAAQPHQFHHQAASRVPNIVVQIPIHGTDNKHGHHQHRGRQASQQAGSTSNGYSHMSRFYGHSSHQSQHQHQRAGCSGSSNEIKSEPIKFELDPLSSGAKPPVAVTTTKSAASLQLAPTADTSTLVTARPKVTVVAAAVAAAASNCATTNANPVVVSTTRTTTTTATTGAAAAAIRCLRCSSCPFISITQVSLDQHVRDRHPSPAVGGSNAQPTFVRRKLACPGCENVFYSRMSLEAHLLNDHQMGADDIAVLLPSLLTASADGADTPSLSTNTTTVTKQKIYLKNVEILRNPVYNVTTNGSSGSSSIPSDNNTDESTYSRVHSIHSMASIDDVHDYLLRPMQTDARDNAALYYPMLGHSVHFEATTAKSTTADDIASADIGNDEMCVIEDYQEPLDPDDFIDLIDDEYDESECTEDVIQPTIFVKHDTVLKNPNTLYRSYANEAVTPKQQHHTIDLIETPPPQPQPQQPAVYADMDNGMPSMYDFATDANNYLDVPQYPSNSVTSTTTANNQQRRPGKIFIKNVDILKQPMFVQSSTSTTVAASTSMSPQLAPMFVPTYAISLNDLLSTSPRLLDNSTPLPMPINSSSTHQPKQIFIKNIDILKEPAMLSISNATAVTLAPLAQSANARPTVTTCGGTSVLYRTDEVPLPAPTTTTTTSEPRRNTLHLRTVEELNLNTETINKESESRLTTLNLRTDEQQLVGNVAKAGTLHLRTVDQLNLMNINEVQNLIENFQEEPTAVVPQLVQQQHQQQQQQQQQQQTSSSSVAVRMDTSVDVNVDDNNDDGQSKEETKKPVVDVFDDVHMFTDYHNASFQSVSHTLDAVLQDLQHHATGSEIAGHYTPGEDLDKYAYAADAFGQSSMCNHFDPSSSSSSAASAPMTVDDADTNDTEGADADVAIIESSTCSLDEKAAQIDKTTAPATASARWYNDNVMFDHQDTFHGSSVTTQSDLLPAATIHLSDNSILEYAREFDENMMFVCAQEIIGSDECSARACDDGGEQAATEPPLPPLLPFDEYREPVTRIEHAGVTTVSDGDPVSTADSVTPRKGRIYVVNNLMKEAATSEATDVGTTTTPATTTVSTGGPETQSKSTIKSATSSKRTACIRPKGRRQIVKEQQSTADEQADEPSSTSPAEATGRHRCSQAHCIMQFGSAALLVYHERCHASDGSLICPDCNSSSSTAPATSTAQFRTWNTLHTHLWRQHAIDMELYSCAQCNFKTPIRSRLTNTHARIHSDERNFKCDRCDKAFKNAKQLKNHRRTHLETSGTVKSSAAGGATTTAGHVHQCRHCDRLFYNQRHLRNHERSLHEGGAEFRCDVCQAVCSSLGAKRTHMRNHETTSRKQHRCSECAYETNDYNSFRRHRRTHAVATAGSGAASAAAMPYQCPFCAYGSIQSTTYARHVQREHPDEAPELVFACGRCKFITVNRRKFDLHVLNHDAMKPEPDTSAATATARTTAFGPTAALAVGAAKGSESEADPLRSASGKRIKVRTGLTEASTATETTDDMC